MNNIDDFLWIVIGAIIAAHIIFGFIAGSVASGRGRDPLLGFLAGLFLNVFGLIIVMLMHPSAEVEAQRRIDSEREYERLLARRRSSPQSRAEPVSGGHGPTDSNVSLIPQTPIEASDYQTSFVGIHRSGFFRQVAEVLGLDPPGIHVLVLSSRKQRSRGFGLLNSVARSDPPVRGALYWWPEGGAHRFAFRNVLDLEVSVLVLDSGGSIVEILALLPHNDADIYPTNPILSAVAVPTRNFEARTLRIGDRILIPKSLRSPAD